MLDSMFEGDYRGKKAHPPDVDAVLARAADAGVERLIVTAGNLEESRRALEFVRAQQQPPAAPPPQLSKADVAGLLFGESEKRDFNSEY